MAKMSDQTLLAIVDQRCRDTDVHGTTTLSKDRTDAMRYYRGDKFGDEQEGRSQVVSRDVAESIDSTLPSLMRIFSGGDQVVMCEPTGPEDEDAAGQATDYANYVWNRVNPGFRIFYWMFKDALLQKLGIVKVWWDATPKVTREEYEGATLAQLEIARADPDNEILEESEPYEAEDADEGEGDEPQPPGNGMLPPGPLAMTPPGPQSMLPHGAPPGMPAMPSGVPPMPGAPPMAGPPQAMPNMPPGMPGAPPMLMPPMPPPPEKLVDFVVRKTNKTGRICISNVPNEEFGMARGAISVEDANYTHHRRKMTLSDLKAMGYPQSKIDMIPADDLWSLSAEKLVRFEDDGTSMPEDSGVMDPSMRAVWLTEAYLLVDYDGDGVAEMRRVTWAGNQIFENEETDENPFAACTPTLMPHKAVGLSMADQTMDLQRIKSTLLRNFLDNVYLQSAPALAVNDDQVVDYNEWLTRRVGQIVRTKGPPGAAFAPLPTQFVGGEIFPVVEYIDSVREQRTGTTRYNQGLDANSLNKMLDIYTDVPMADGSYKILRDVADGDRIIGADGLPVTVVRAHEIHAPERAYRITFASGEEIIAGGEHLWTVMTQNDRDAGRSRVVDTDALYQRFHRFGANIYVPRVQRPQAGAQIVLPLDPYILGVWLGDGHSYSARVTTADDEIVGALERWADTHDGVVNVEASQNSGKAITYSVRGAAHGGRTDIGQFAAADHTLHATLGRMGLLRHRDYPASNCKHIPKVYFAASYAQRLELLRGLMDTDGCHHSGALCIFSQKEGRLFADVKRLVESLGGWPGFSEVDPGELARDGVTYLNMTFHLFDNPFKLSSKANKWRAPRYNATSQPIVAIEPADIRPMRCLTVDADDGLFCVGRRWTVTHNTATGINMIQQAAGQRIELIARSFAETGVKPAFRKLLKLASQYVKKAEKIRLRGQWVDVDPRAWANGFDMSVSVGLGTGNKDQVVAHMMGLLQVDQQIIQMQQGVQGPLLTAGNLYKKLEKLVQAMGMHSVEPYYSDPDSPKMQQQLASKPPPPPSPEIMAIQTQQQLNAATAQNNQHKLQVDAMDKQATQQLAARKQTADEQYKQRELDIREREAAIKEAELGIKSSDTNIRASLEQAKIIDGQQARADAQAAAREARMHEAMAARDGALGTPLNGQPAPIELMQAHAQRLDALAGAVESLRQPKRGRMVKRADGVWDFHVEAPGGDVGAGNGVNGNV